MSYNAFRSLYTAPAINIVNEHGLRNQVHHENKAVFAAHLILITVLSVAHYKQTRAL